METEKRKRGFASLSPEQRREIARRGGKTAHEKGRAHRFTSEEARAAGRKGGLASTQRRAQRTAQQPQAQPSGQVIQFPTQPIEQALSGLSFPASKSDIIERAGNQQLTASDGKMVALRNLLEQSSRDSFGSLSELTEEIGRILTSRTAA